MQTNSVWQGRSGRGAAGAIINRQWVDLRPLREPEPLDAPDCTQALLKLLPW